MTREQRVELAHQHDAKLAALAEQDAKNAIGVEYAVKQGRNRVRGKVTTCVFSGFGQAGARYKAFWEITVTHAAGGSLTITSDRCPRG